MQKNNLNIIKFLGENTSLLDGASLFAHVFCIVAFWRTPFPSRLFEERLCIRLWSSTRTGTSVVSPDCLCKDLFSRGVFILRRDYKTSAKPLLDLNGKVIVEIDTMFHCLPLAFHFRWGDWFERAGFSERPGWTELGEVRRAGPDSLARDQGQHDGAEPAE